MLLSQPSPSENSEAPGPERERREGKGETNGTEREWGEGEFGRARCKDKNCEFMKTNRPFNSSSTMRY